MKNEAGYHPGQVSPSRADGAPSGTIVKLIGVRHWNVKHFCHMFVQLNKLSLAVGKLVSDFYDPTN